MSRFFTRERFGSAQFIAGFILLVFFLQCLWFCSRVPLTDREIAFILQGQHEWRGREVVMHALGSPITGLLASLPVLTSQATQEEEVPPFWRWAARLPFMLIGVLFGASIWYVARRLYGNPGGYIAVILYAFSPFFIIHSTLVQPDVVAGWGAFGVIFTAIGLSHSLYAPREVILWNWKRILLLGVAIGVSCAAHPAVIFLLPVALGFMWYLVPERRGAATVILLAGCVIGSIVLWATYAFRLSAAWQAILSSHLLPLSSDTYTAGITWSWLAIFFIRQQPTFTLLLVIAVITFFAWKRPRFFGTQAPLIVFALLLVLGIGMPTQGAMIYYLMALPFAFVFVSGVLTDMLESRYAPVSFGVVVGILIGHILISVTGLLRM